jgi:hypothetical protein
MASKDSMRFDYLLREKIILQKINFIIRRNLLETIGEIEEVLTKAEQEYKDKISTEDLLKLQDTTFLFYKDLSKFLRSISHKAYQHTLNLEHSNKELFNCDSGK